MAYELPHTPKYNIMNKKDQRLLEEAYQSILKSSKINMKFNQIYQSILESLICEKKDPAGMKTFWQDGDIKITMKDVLSYLDSQNVPIKNVDINKVKEILINQDYEGKQKGRVEKANLDYPIIVVVKNGKYKSILDGNHRTFKAIQQGLKEVPVRELNLNTAPKEYKQLLDYEIEKHFKK